MPFATWFLPLGHFSLQKLLHTYSQAVSSYCPSFADLPAQAPILARSGGKTVLLCHVPLCMNMSFTLVSLPNSTCLHTRPHTNFARTTAWATALNDTICALQVLASGRSRTTSRRSSMRRATDSDTSFAYHPQEGTGSIAAVHDYAAVLSTNHIMEDECQAASQGQSLGVIKVQRSLTWTEGSEINHSQQGMDSVLFNHWTPFSVTAALPSVHTALFSFQGHGQHCKVYMTSVIQ